MDKWLPRLVRWGAIGLAGLLLLVDMASGAWLAAVSGLVVVVLALITSDLFARVVAAMVVSVVTGAGALVVAPGVGFLGPAEAISFGLAEAAGLGLLLVVAMRHLAVRTARWVVPVLSLVIVALPLRMGGDQQTLAVGLAFCVMLAIALGTLLRMQDNERAGALSRVRSDERLSLARDLHDSVAHHVTGIVVRAQAAQVVAPEQPDEAVAALAAIEREGLATLTSMRRLVGVLREDDAQRHPPPGLAQIRDLVARFGAGGGPRATLSASPAAAGAKIPDEVGGALHRVVQEALTNVRRHADGPRRVTVEIDVVDDQLHVRVDDDGTARRTWTRRSDGYGVVGLSERVHALGGWLTAGPRADGGWRVTAALPLTNPPPEGVALPPPGSGPRVAP